jgi:hypothetical protein
MESARDALPLHYTRLTLTDKELRSFFIAYASDEIGWDRVTNFKATRGRFQGSVSNSLRA